MSTTTIQINIINSKVKQYVFQGTLGRQYYQLEFNGILSTLPIDMNVPVKWMLNETRKFYGDFHTGKIRTTGPFHCNGCRNVFFKGIFVGYCGICAEMHNYDRGAGLTGHKTMEGKPYEFDILQKNGNIVHIPENKSMWKTYFKDVDINQIGEIEKYRNGYYVDKGEEKIYYNFALEEEEEEEDHQNWYDDYEEDEEYEEEYNSIRYSEYMENKYY